MSSTRWMVTNCDTPRQREVINKNEPFAMERQTGALNGHFKWEASLKSSYTCCVTPIQWPSGKGSTIETVRSVSKQCGDVQGTQWGHSVWPYGGRSRSSQSSQSRNTQHPKWTSQENVDLGVKSKWVHQLFPGYTPAQILMKEGCVRERG